MSPAPGPESRAVLADPVVSTQIEAARQGARLGHRAQHFATCESTQAEAQRLARQGAPHGLVVTAATQTQGRGRRGRHFGSDDGGLYLSLLLRPQMRPEHLPRLPLLACVGLCDALTGQGIEPAIKWPNDLLIPSPTPGTLGLYRKVAGILAEPSFQGATLDFVILGIGLNVKRPAGGFGAALEPIAGALSDLGCAQAPQAMLAPVLDGLTPWLENPSDSRMFSRCVERLTACSATLGRRVHVVEEDRVGVAESFDEEGALWVRLPDGECRRVLAGDVVWA